MESNKFASSLDDLATGIATDTENYQYSLTASSKETFTYAIPKDKNNMSYVGGVFIVSEGEDQQSVTVVCVADQPGNTRPNKPFLQDNEPTCADGTTIVY